MNKRIVILWAYFLVWAIPLMAQDVLGGMVVAFKEGNSQELSGYLSGKVKLILEDRSISVNHRTAEGKTAALFFGNQVSGFTANRQGKRSGSGLIVGTLTTANGNLRVSCFFRKVANKHVIYQVRIDKTSE